MRGRLICPVVANIARLDPVATGADPSGYDDVFGETKVLTDEDGKRVSARKEMEWLTLRCQVETPKVEELVMQQGGIALATRIGLVFHLRDLERAGLMDAETNHPKFQVNDRLVELRHRRTNKLLQTFPNPPGLYAISTSVTSYGLGGDVNLFLVFFEERTQGVAS